MKSPVESPRVVRFGAFEADLRAGELRKNGLKVKLQDQPFQVLLMLLEHAGEVDAGGAAPETLACRHLCGLRTRGEQCDQPAA